jgi:hypothetical protein
MPPDSIQKSPGLITRPQATATAACSNPSTTVLNSVHESSWTAMKVAPPCSSARMCACPACWRAACAQAKMRFQPSVSSSAQLQSTPSHSWCSMVHIAACLVCTQKVGTKHLCTIGTEFWVQSRGERTRNG